jgi:hypothetical protein
MRAGFPVLACAALLAGCGPSDAQVRGELRTQLMQRCATDIAPRAAGLAGFEADRFCACIADRAVGERSIDELKAMFGDREKMALEGRGAGTRCLGQQIPSAVPPLIPGRNETKAKAPPKASPKQTEKAGAKER